MNLVHSINEYIIFFRFLTIFNSIIIVTSFYCHHGFIYTGGLQHQIKPLAFTRIYTYFIKHISLPALQKIALFRMVLNYEMALVIGREMVLAWLFRNGKLLEGLNEGMGRC